MSASPSPLPRVKNAAPCRGRCRAQLYATKERYRCGLPLSGTHRPVPAAADSLPCVKGGGTAKP